MYVHERQRTMEVELFYYNGLSRSIPPTRKGSWLASSVLPLRREFPPLRRLKRLHERLDVLVVSDLAVRDPNRRLVARHEEQSVEPL